MPTVPVRASCRHQSNKSWSNLAASINQAILKLHSQHQALSFAILALIVCHNLLSLPSHLLKSPASPPKTIIHPTPAHSFFRLCGLYHRPRAPSIATRPSAILLVLSATCVRMHTRACACEVLFFPIDESLRTHLRPIRATERQPHQPAAHAVIAHHPLSLAKRDNSFRSAA